MFNFTFLIVWCCLPVLAYNYLKITDNYLNLIIIVMIKNVFFQVEKCLKNLRELSHEYQLVSNKTNSLHQVSEELISDQVLLFYFKFSLMYEFKFKKGTGFFF